MEVLFDASSEYSFGGHWTKGFDELEKETGGGKNLLLAHGIHAGFRRTLPDDYKHYVYIEAEEPCGFQDGKLPHERGEPDTPWCLDYWDEILHITGPHLCDYLNKCYNTDKFKPAIMPIHSKWLEEDVEKRFSVLYCGGQHDYELAQFVEVIAKFPKYRHISAWLNFPHITDGHISDQERMKIMRRTKISVIRNSHRGRYGDVVNMPYWDEFSWTSHINEHWVPMFKTRVSDSAFCKCLMLVHRDPWNVMEMFFEPDKDFIYFDDEKDLEVKINDCLNNWEMCEKIANNAHEKFMKYHCTSKFYERYLEKYDKNNG